ADSFAIQSAPNPNAAALGFGPAGKVLRGLPVVGLISVTVSSRRLVTPTAPGLLVMLLRPVPTPVFCVTASVSGLIRSSFLAPELVTQTESPATAIAVGASSTGIVSCTVPLLGSTRETVSANSFTTQMDPKPEAIFPGPLPTATSL